MRCLIDDKAYDGKRNEEEVIKRMITKRNIDETKGIDRKKREQTYKYDNRNKRKAGRNPIIERN